MEIGALVIILIMGIILIITFYVIGLYNALVNSKNKVLDKFNQIDIEIDKVMDLITCAIDVVKENTKQEDKKINEVLAGTSLVLDAKNMNERLKFYKGLDKVLNEMLSLSNTYPELKKNKIFTNFKKCLKEAEAKIDYASSFYNKEAEEYNNMIKTFPYNIISKVFKFKEIELYKIEK